MLQHQWLCLKKYYLLSFDQIQENRYREKKIEQQALKKSISTKWNQDLEHTLTACKLVKLIYQYTGSKHTTSPR